MFNFIKMRLIKQNKVDGLMQQVIDLQVKQKELELTVKSKEQELALEKQKMQSDFTIKKTELESLLKLRKEQDVSQIKLEYEKRFNAQETDYKEKLSVMEGKMAKEYYEKLEKELSKFNEKGNVSTTFMRDIALKMLDKGRDYGAHKNVTKVITDARDGDK